MTARSIALFIAASLAEIGGAYLVWIGLREHKGALFSGDDRGQGTKAL